ncbi:MAG: histidine kinase, partial [Deltaproteobacteria bacterium]|nr:histidine kinase [Deltaproteobacteria bacterium]
MPLLIKKLNKRNWFRFVVGHPYAVLTFVFMITLAFGWKLPDLSFQTSIYDLTIKDLPETIRYQDFKDEFGSEELILVVVDAGNVFDTTTFLKIDLLSDKLSRIKGVKRVVSLPDIKKAMDVTDKWSLAE